MAVRLRKDKTGYHRVCHIGDNTHLGGNYSAAWPTVCYLRKVHPTHVVTSQARPASFGMCTDPPPSALVCCKEGDRYKNVPLPGYWVHSFLFLLCIPLNQGVTSQTSPEGCRIDLQIQNFIEASYRFPWEAKGLKLNNLKLVHLVKFQRKRANVGRCTWVLTHQTS